MKQLEKDSVEQIARCAEMPFVDLSSYRISPGILRKLPTRVAQDLRCVPIVFNARRVVLVHDDVARACALAANPVELLQSTNLLRKPELPLVEVALTTSDALDTTLDRMN